MNVLTPMKNDRGASCMQGNNVDTRLPAAANTAFDFQHNHHHAGSGGAECKTWEYDVVHFTDD